MPQHNPIIVVGCPRSGTTMLQLMLHAHPLIAIGPETRFVLAAYEHRRDFGDLRVAEHRRQLARWIVDRPQTRFADLGLDADEVVERVVAAPPTVGSALAAVFQAYAARFDKPRWGDKRPAYLQNLDVILRLFPDAQIINIVRDGRDCVASLKEMSWHRDDIYTTVAAWARAIDDGQRAARRLPDWQYHQLRYEDLVADPAGQLAGVCAFLGEQYDPVMVRPAAAAEVALPKRKTWHDRARSEVTTQRVRSWERRLTAEEIALCESALGSRLVACGYELSGGGRPPARGLARYQWIAARHRLAPAKRAVERTAERLVRRPPVAHRTTAAPPVIGQRGHVEPPSPAVPSQERRADGQPAAYDRADRRHTGGD